MNHESKIMNHGWLVLRGKFIEKTLQVKLQHFAKLVRSDADIAKDAIQSATRDISRMHGNRCQAAIGVLHD